MKQNVSPFKFNDLFAGIGGLRRGLDMIGVRACSPAR